MLTPKDVQEITFVKAVFGGYDMKSVDDYLDTISEDYISLYNENASLKSKLRILVGKIEEYRSKEDALNQAQIQAAALLADAERKSQLPENVASAQARGEEILTEANAQQEAILGDAKAQQESILEAARLEAERILAEAREKAQAMEAQAAEHESRSRVAADRASAVALEEQRVENAQKVARNFISAVEEAVNKHIGLLEDIRKLDPVAAPRAYDYDSEADPAAAADSAEAVLEEVSRNIERFYGDGESPEDGETKVRRVPERFNDLQFGPGYDPRA